MSLLQGAAAVAASTAHMMYVHGDHTPHLIPQPMQPGVHTAHVGDKRGGHDELDHGEQVNKRPRHMEHMPAPMFGPLQPQAPGHDHSVHHMQLEAMASSAAAAAAAGSGSASPDFLGKKRSRKAKLRSEAMAQAQMIRNEIATYDKRGVIDWLASKDFSAEAIATLSCLNGEKLILLDREALVGACGHAEGTALYLLLHPDKAYDTKAGGADNRKKRNQSCSELGKFIDEYRRLADIHGPVEVEHAIEKPPADKNAFDESPTIAELRKEVCRWLKTDSLETVWSAWYTTVAGLKQGKYQDTIKALTDLFFKPYFWWIQNRSNYDESLWKMLRLPGESMDEEHTSLPPDLWPKVEAYVSMLLPEQHLLAEGSDKIRQIRLRFNQRCRMLGKAAMVRIKKKLETFQNRDISVNVFRQLPPT